MIQVWSGGVIRNVVGESEHHYVLDVGFGQVATREKRYCKLVVEL